MNFCARNQDERPANVPTIDIKAAQSTYHDAIAVWPALSDGTPESYDCVGRAECPPGAKSGHQIISPERIAVSAQSALRLCFASYRPQCCEDYRCRSEAAGGAWQAAYVADILKRIARIERKINTIRAIVIRGGAAAVGWGCFDYLRRGFHLPDIAPFLIAAAIGGAVILLTRTFQAEDD